MKPDPVTKATRYPSAELKHPVQRMRFGYILYSACGIEVLARMRDEAWLVLRCAGMLSGVVTLIYSSSKISVFYDKLVAEHWFCHFHNLYDNYQ